jgi:hypothetical protein
MKTLVIFALLVAIVSAQSFVETSAQVNIENAATSMAEDSMELQRISSSMEEESAALEEDAEAFVEVDSQSQDAPPIVQQAAAKAEQVAEKAGNVIAKAAALANIANSLKEGGKDARKALLKNKDQIKEMAKKLGLSAKQVKKAIKNPGKALKKAKKLTKKANKKIKKAVNKAKKAAAVASTFQPKEQGVLMKKTDLTKQLKKVVEGEPESAAIQKAKNNWLWEDVVFQRLDKYVPPDPKNIKDRVEKFEKEADESCGKAQGLCVQQKLNHPVNIKTCVKAKKACFHAKVAVRVISKASVVCVETEAVCGRTDWKGKGDCLVSKAKCKRLLLATDYQSTRTHQVGKIVRDMEFHDNEANELRDKVEKDSDVKDKVQKEHDGAEPEADKCKKAMETAKKCEIDMDESPPCKKATKKAEACEDSLQEFEKIKDKLKSAKKVVQKTIQEKNAAEAEAQQGF